MFFMHCTPPLCCVFYASALNAPAKVLGPRELAECTTKMTHYTIVGIVSVFYALYSPLACVTVFWVS